jgi:hypothetical protein
MNFILKQFYTGIKNKSISEIKKNIICESIPNDKLNDLFENIIISALNKRCEDLSFTSSIIKDDTELKIKLFGEKNYLFDNSKWVKIRNDKKFDYNLKIKEDLYLCECDIFNIIIEHLKFLEIDETKFYKHILQISKVTDLNNLNDLKELINDMLSSRINV